MAWIKIPAEHHPLFHAALPKDPRVSTLLMFGGLAAKANGQMFAGLFARSALVKLSTDDQARALALDGAGPFDPMGNGRVMRDTVLLPDSIMEEADELRDWLRRGFDYVLTLPPKASKPKAKAPPAKVPAAKAAAGGPAARKPAPKSAASKKVARSGARKAAAKKPAAKKPAAKKPAAKKSAAKKPAAARAVASKSRR